ncbi:hypothetical protein [Oceanobacillus picturae]|uniref:hypothetical protein n=1 Tax=Oceanobacillus picturae TaxID=171693 RepID=UPI00362A34C0
MIYIKMVLEVQGADKTNLFRVIWMDAQRKSMYIIDIYDPKAKPFECDVEDYQSLIKSKSAKVIEDPTLDYFELTEKSEQVWRERIAILERLGQEIEAPEIFHFEKIWKTLVKLERSLDCSANYMKKILRLYWQNGLNYKALVPKFGRKKIHNNCEQSLRLPKDLKKQELNWKEVIISSFDKYYKKNSKATLQSAYLEMLELCFSKKIEVDGISKLQLEDSYPSYWQFEYHTRHLRYTKDTLSKRWGSKNFELKGREILSVSQEKVYGPGSLFQIDATIADVFIVASINREDIIGRPVLYFVTDSFSRLITGVYCGLEGPSWNGQMMALVNSASDKVAFCQRYGVNIVEEEWPCAHIPQAIRGDRGELISAMAEEMVRLQGINIENTPPFRADLKGVVERKFGIIQGSIKPIVPGYIDSDYRVRGGKDYRLEAALTLEEFTKIIILEILNHNAKLIKGYRKPKDLLKDKVPAQPIKLWSWGIRNRSGMLRKVTEKEMKLTLMPRYEALVTAQGVKYRGMFYTSRKAVEEEWFSRARVRGSWKIKIRVDERNTNNIYYWDDKTNNIEPFELVPFDKERFSDLSFDEVAALITYENYRNNQIENDFLESKINKTASVREIVTKAKENTDRSHTETSNKKRTEGISNNRSKEKEKMRKQESFKFVENELDIQKSQNKTESSDSYNDAESKQDILDILDNLEKKSGW